MIEVKLKSWCWMILGLALATIAHAQDPSSCAVGAYRAPDGNLVAITPSASGSPPGARYTLLDGRRGYTSEKDSPLRCDKGTIRSVSAEGNSEPWTRMSFRLTPVTFPSGDAVLNGLLMEPEPVSSAAKPPLVIFVHGSEEQSPIGLYYQYLLSAQGIATFFYDKRGTGRSTGKYTQNFYVLADDAANAGAAARRLAAGRYSRIGFFGGSQGGWVAPLAALKAGADFVEIGFGVVGTPIEQDQWQVEYQLRRLGYLGYSDTIDADVREVTNSTASVAASNFSRNVEDLDRVRAKFSREPWFAAIDGQYSGELLRGEIEKAKAESPGVPWDYPATAPLKQLNIPQLWIFAGDDSVAPSLNSVKRLQPFRNGRHPVDSVVFPHTDHGIKRFTEDEKGNRTTGGLADGYLRLLGEWAKQSLKPPYGTAVWVDADRAPVSSAAHSTAK